MPENEGKHEPLTDAQFRALEILATYGQMTPKAFAKKMWPDSEGWQRWAKCGPKGVTRGVGMCLKAGAYLSYLERRGWVTYHYPFNRGRPTYSLKLKGRIALVREAERRGVELDLAALH